MKKIMAVFATTPEAIKLCPLLDILLSKKEFEVKVCFSGHQLQDVQQVLDIYMIEPDYVLSMDEKNKDLYDTTITILEEIKNVLKSEEPDLVLVQGDSTSSFATSLACFYLDIPLGHIEAGLRTYNIHSPFPEEYNRQAVSISARYNFVPTRKAKVNLIKEGRDPSSIYITGNTAVDVLRKTIRSDYTHPYLEWANTSRLIILTSTCRDEMKDTLKNVVKAIKRVVNDEPEVKVIFPLHTDTDERVMVEEEIGNNDKILLIPPLPVNDFHNFLNKSYFILTDSEGIQVEAPSLGKPVLVMKENTERPEGVAAGNLKLIGTNEEDIVRHCKWLLSETALYNKMSKAFNPYGDGYASDRIADIILTGRRWEWNERSSSQLDFNRK